MPDQRERPRRLMDGLSVYIDESLPVGEIEHVDGPALENLLHKMRRAGESDRERSFRIDMMHPAPIQSHVRMSTKTLEAMGLIDAATPQGAE